MKKYILIAILLSVGFGLAYYLGRKTAPPVPAVPLPPEVIIQTEVRRVPVPEYIEVPVEGPPLKPVEVVRWKTKAAEIPEPVIEYVERIVTLPAPERPPLLARVEVDGVKFEGYADGRLAYGWKGKAVCLIQGVEAAEEWFPLVDEPFSFESSTAITSLPIKPPTPWRTTLRLGVTTSSELDFGASWFRRGRWGLYLNGQWNPDPETVSYSYGNYYEEMSQSVHTEDRWRLAIGATFNLGRE